MASARKCDICGKFYTTDDNYTVMTLTEYNDNEFKLGKSRYYDICTGCVDRIMHHKDERSKEVNCATCGVLDLNCREQCKEK